MNGNPRYFVTKREGVGGPRIPEDEPYLVIRAQDKLAPLMLSTYLSAYTALPEECQDQRVIDELVEHVTRLHRWQQHHPDRMKYADR